MVVTLILSIVFFKERVFFVDPGTQLFEMINTEGFRVFVNRYSMIINQALPLLCIKAGLPLKYIVLSYSVSFILIYYACFLICVYGLKNVPAGLSIALAPIVIRAAFGHSISETWLGLAYGAVFFALIAAYPHMKTIIKRALTYAGILLMVFVNYYIHQGTLFTMIFSIGFLFFYEKKFRSPHYYVTALLVLIPFIYNFLFPSHVHDAGFFSNLKGSWRMIAKLNHLPLFIYTKKYFWGIYILPVLLAFIALPWYIKNKKIPVYAFATSFTFFYFCIACIAFYKGDSDFALESRLIPTGFFIIILFSQMVISTSKKIYPVALIIVMIFSFGNLVVRVKDYHSSRIAYYKNVFQKLEKYPEKKFFIRQPAGVPAIVNSWGVSTETLFLSSMENPDNSKTFVFVEHDFDGEKGPDTWPCTFLWVSWWLYYNEDFLSKKYFHLNCSSYREIPYEEVAP